jgi:hypothetical protein
MKKIKVELPFKLISAKNKDESLFEIETVGNFIMKLCL